MPVEKKRGHSHIFTSPRGATYSGHTVTAKWCTECRYGLVKGLPGTKGWVEVDKNNIR